MNAPDKIYMTPSYGEPDNVLLASFSKSHLDCHRDIEYIRKDALLEWVKLAYGKLSMNPFDVRDVFEELIDKIK